MNSPSRQPPPGDDPAPATCPNCDGYGWLEPDDEQGSAQDCVWCGGIGYVLRDARGHTTPLTIAQQAAHAATLEALEAARLRALGYSGDAKPPWEQRIRRQGRDDDRTAHEG